MLGVEELVIAEGDEDALPGIELLDGSTFEALALDLEDDAVHVADRGDDLCADLVARVQEVDLGEVAVVATRPDLGAGLDRDELRRDAQPISAPPHRALHHVAGRQLFTHLPSVRALAAEALGGAAGKHDRLTGVADAIDHLAPQARREVVDPRRRRRCSETGGLR